MRKLLTSIIIFVFMLGVVPTAQTPPSGSFDSLIWSYSDADITSGVVTHFQVLDYTAESGDGTASVWVTVPLTFKNPNNPNEYFYPLTPLRGGLHNPMPTTANLNSVRVCNAVVCSATTMVPAPTEIDLNTIRRGTITIP